MSVYAVEKKIKHFTRLEQCVLKISTLWKGKLKKKHTLCFSPLFGSLIAIVIYSPHTVCVVLLQEMINITSVKGRKKKKNTFLELPLVIILQNLLHTCLHRGHGEFV